MKINSTALVKEVLLSVGPFEKVANKLPKPVNLYSILVLAKL